MALNLSFGTGAPPELPENDILRLKANQVVQVYLLSSRIQDVYIHWNQSVGRKGRSEPCQSTGCKGCQRQLPRKWLGYVHCWLPKQQRSQFLELPASAAADLVKLIPPGGTMRGMNTVIQRMAGDKTRLKIDVFPAPASFDESLLPEEKTPWKTLEMLWNMSRAADEFQV